MCVCVCVRFAVVVWEEVVCLFVVYMVCFAFPSSLPRLMWDSQ